MAIIKLNNQSISSVTALPAGVVDANALASGVGGKVIQVQYGTLTSTFSTSSSTYTDTGLSVTITPTSASNKILVIANHPSIGTENNQSSIYCATNARLLRNGSTIQVGTFGVRNMATSTNKSWYTSLNFSILDNPATTSALTYKTQTLADAPIVSTGTYFFASASQINTITAMEIA